MARCLSPFPAERRSHKGDRHRAALRDPKACKHSRHGASPLCATDCAKPRFEVARSQVLGRETLGKAGYFSLGASKIGRAENERLSHWHLSAYA